MTAGCQEFVSLQYSLLLWENCSQEFVAAFDRLAVSGVGQAGLRNQPELASSLVRLLK